METAESIDRALRRLMPRGMSEEGTRSLEAVIDELAAGEPAGPDWLRIGVWSTGSMAAALALFFGLRGPGEVPVVAGGVVSSPRVELVSVVEGVVAVDPVESLVAGEDGTLHREWHMQVVTEERFHDRETGHDVRVTRPRGEFLRIPVTSF